MKRQVNRAPFTASCARQRGVGILEVLVALIVISLGVLGMAGLQLTGMKQSTNGFNRAKAVMLADSMATRMRINRSAVASFLYDDFDSTEENCEARPVPYCQARQGANADRCDAEELASFDKFMIACGDWGTAGASGGVTDMLPAGSKLSVDCDDDPCTSDSTYTLRVTWPEGVNASSSDAPADSRVQMRLRP